MDKKEIDALEQERDFYFHKLRDIELYCQSVEKNPIVEAVLEIMYKTQDGFEVPHDEETF